MEPIQIPGTNASIGISQLKVQTPKWISNAVNGIIFLCATWAMFSGMITEIPDDTKAEITRWMLIGSGFIKFASKFFGFKIEEPTPQ